MSRPKYKLTFAAVAAMVACFVSLPAAAAMVWTNDFETAAGFVGVGEDQFAVLEYTNNAPGVSAEYPFASFGSKYLSVDTGESAITNTFTSQSSSTYFDSWVKFSPMYGDADDCPNSKFRIYLDAATSNLCVISGTSANDTTPVTNVLTRTLEPDTWGRLTINAIKGSSAFSFQVRLNGDLLTTGSADTFYSLTSDLTLSQVIVSGAGALDNFAIRTTDPFIASGDKAATVGEESYYSLDQALSEANGATISLDGNHAAVGVSVPGTYVVDAGSYTFGGLFGLGGAAVSSSPSGSVTTYTVTAPVAIWDGAASACNFSTLTRTCGDTTYTMTVNDANATVNGANDYITIGSENQKWTVKITANKEGAFGSASASGFTLIAKAAKAGTSAGSNRAVLNYYTTDSQASVAFAQSSGGGAFPMVNEAAWSASATAANTLLSDGTVQTLALTYGSASGGTRLYVDGSLKWSNSGSTGFTGVPDGITLGGVPIDNSNKLFALCGMKVYAVAVFKTKLTDEQVAAYEFPSEISPSIDLDAMMSVSENTSVSTINSVLGGKSEIWLMVSDGVTITGDTTFNASTVHFHSKGEVVVCPPSGNTATFDFANTAKPVVAYNGTCPSKSGDKFTAATVPNFVTDSSSWTGTVWIKNYAGITGNNFLPNNYGNAASTLRLTGISGWIWSATSNNTIAPAVELYDEGGSYGLCLSDGYSYGGNNLDNFTILSELKGTGTLVAYNKAPYVLLNVRKWDGFSGTLSLTNKIVCFGSEIPASSAFTSENGGRNGGLVWVASDATLDIPSSWYLGNSTSFGNVVVEGTLSYASLAKLSASAKVVLRDEGKINVPGTATAADFAKDFAKVSGTGTLLLTPSSSSSWIGLPTNNLSTALGVEITQGSLVVPPDAGNTSHATNVVEIGSLSGSGTIQGNYGDYYAYRKLRIIQSTNTVWSGTVNADGYNRLYEFAVAPGASAGTLTISGNNSNKDTMLTVESGAKVDITGTWKGATTVAGTLGGTGTVTGNLTLADGATLKASAPSVSGNLTATGAIALELPAGALDGGSCTLLSVGGTADLSGATFTATVDGVSVDMSRYEVKAVNGQLLLQLIPVKRGTGLLLF